MQRRGGGGLRTVREDRRANGKHTGGPHRPEPECGARDERERADEREQERHERARDTVVRTSPSVSARSRRREAKPREPDSEQRAAPLGQQRLDGFGALVVERLGDLGGRVARSGK